MVTAATPLARASSLIGRPVITNDGEKSHEVQDLVLDDDGRTVVGLTLRHPGIFGKRHVAVVPLDAVTSIGPDAVMVQDKAAFVHDERDPAVCADVVNSKVVTGDGIEIGPITDVVVETRRNRMRVEAVEIGRDGPAGYLVLGSEPSLAGDVVVVADGAQDRIDDTPEAAAERLGHTR
jgi:uncharacterized protein YrrD